MGGVGEHDPYVMVVSREFPVSGCVEKRAVTEEYLVVKNMDIYIFSKNTPPL